MTYVEFTNEVRGYAFYSKKTWKQVYRFELFWSGLTPKKCFEKFESRIIYKPIEY